MRRFNLGLSAAAALSAVMYCAPLAAAAPAASGEELVTLVARNVQQTVIGDGSSQGSGIANTQDLYRDNQLVGRDGATCTIVRVSADNSRDMQCQVTLFLAQGDIIGQGVLTFTQAPTDFDIAITGGTRNYRHASGYIHGHVVNDTDTELTLYISS